MTYDGSGSAVVKSGSDSPEMYVAKLVLKNLLSVGTYLLYFNMF